jgi:hypothetical protein
MTVGGDRVGRGWNAGADWRFVVSAACADIILCRDWRFAIASAARFSRMTNKPSSSTSLGMTVGGERFWPVSIGSLRGLNLSCGLTQDFVWTGVLDFVLGCFLLPLRGWGLAGARRKTQGPSTSLGMTVGGDRVGRGWNAGADWRFVFPAACANVFLHRDWEFAIASAPRFPGMTNNARSLGFARDDSGGRWGWSRVECWR